MGKLKSLTCEIMEKLEAEGRVSHIEIKFDQDFYDEMVKVNRDSKRKQAASILESRKILLD